MNLKTVHFKIVKNTLLSNNVLTIHLRIQIVLFDFDVGALTPDLGGHRPHVVAPPGPLQNAMFAAKGDGKLRLNLLGLAVQAVVCRY